MDSSVPLTPAPVARVQDITRSRSRIRSR